VDVSSEGPTDLYGFSRITRTSITVKPIQVDKILNGALAVWQVTRTAFFAGAINFANNYFRPFQAQMNNMSIVVPNHFCGHFYL
jgi:hypothetical protein